MLSFVVFGAIMINPKLDVDGAVDATMKKFDHTQG